MMNRHGDRAKAWCLHIHAEASLSLEPLSDFAFNFNSCRYITAHGDEMAATWARAAVPFIMAGVSLGTGFRV